MEDIYSFQDVIHSAAWDAALFATYALSLSFFEAVPLIGLRAKGCRSIRLLADVDGYRASMSEAGAAHVGRTYDVTPVLVKGEYYFHPKLSVVVGKEGARAMVGSGNMTFMGWGGNLEFMDYLEPGSAPAAFADIAGFLGGLSEAPRLQSSWPDLSQVMTGCMAAAGRAREGRVRFVHNLASPLADQLKDFADAVGGATGLRVIAPFWSSGAAIVELASTLNVDDVAIGVCEQPGERFPFEEVEKSGLKVRAVTGELLTENTRRLHGKLLVIEGRRGDVVLTGSANGSQAALTRMQNVEGGVLRIIETTSRLGWQAVDRPPREQASEEEEAEAQQGLVVLARFDGQELTGRLLAETATTQSWAGTLSDGRADRKIRLDVFAGADGTFAVREKAVADFLWQSGNAVLLELHAGALEAAGWVTQSPYLEAVRERGALAESVIRLIGGSEDEKDLEAILQYLVERPDALLSANGGGGGSAEKKDASPSQVMLDPQRLGPIADSAIPRSGGGGLGGGASAFEQLLRRFRAYVGLLPERRDEKGQGDEGADGDGDEDGDAGTKTPRAPRVGADLKRFLEAFEVRIEARKGTQGARDDLLTYLDVMLFVTSRIEDGDEARSRYLLRWRRLVAECAPNGGAIDALEQAFGLVVVAGGKGRDADVTSHAALQRRVGGVVSNAYRQSIIEGETSSLAQRLLPGLDHAGWAALMDRIAATRTPWVDAQEMWECVQAGKGVEKGNSLLSERDAPVLLEMISGRRDKNRLKEVRGSQHDLSYCPIHRIKLAEVEMGRLTKRRLARTNCCSKILINLEP